MTDKIHLTVAAVVCQNKKYLMVKEQSEGLTVLNQPAGHVEPGESPVVAVTRETFEETAWLVKPSYLLNFSVFTSPDNHVTYYRLTFVCEPLSQRADPDIDPDILEVLWLTREEFLSAGRPRSPMVQQAIEDYEAGVCYPLEFIRDYR
jgi:ADP-ribose pyrophosphatase YjhB (NUDIX family)